MNHEVITEEQSQKLIGQYDKLGNTIIENKCKTTKEVEGLKKFFADSYVLTAEEENKRIEQMNQHYEQEKLKIQEKENKIKEIIQTATNEKREFTTSERISLQALQDEMDRTAIQHMSKNQMEQKLFMRICEYKLVKLQRDKQQKLLKIVPKQEIRLLKMRKRLEMIKSHMRYVYGMSQEHLIKKKRMQLLQKRIVNIIALFQQQEISIRKL